MALVQVLQHFCSTLGNFEVQVYEVDHFDIPTLTHEEAEMLRLANSLLERLARKQETMDRRDNLHSIQPRSKKLRYHDSPTSNSMILTPAELEYPNDHSRANWIPNNGAGYFGRSLVPFAMTYSFFEYLNFKTPYALLPALQLFPLVMI